MGHDIYAYRLPQEHDDVAYLRRNAGADDRSTIYVLLGQEAHDNGVSGDGEYVICSSGRLRHALEQARQAKVEPDIVAFLDAALTTADATGDEAVLIHFG